MLALQNSGAHAAINLTNPSFLETWLPLLGATAFGAVVGWVTAEVMARSNEIGVKHLAIIVGVIGGAAVTRLFGQVPALFGAYSIGLLLGYIMFYVLHQIDGSGTPTRRFH